MSLKERDTNKALKIFNINVTKSFDLFNSNSSFNFLVCSGAARIDWSPPSSWEKPEYHYLLLDFITGSRLCDLDINLTASIILGLRIAYHYFVRRDGRIMSFEAFQVRAYDFLKHFRINVVLKSIRNHLLSGLNKKLILVFHIDEFQEIFAFENSWKGGLSRKGLFKEMLCALRPLMMKSETTNRLFLRVCQVSFLSNKSIIEIFDYFAKKGGDKEKHWMCNTKFLQLLYDISRLPRALETILDKCFKRDGFFPKLKDKNFTFFDNIFYAVINNLIRTYKLDNFIMKNRKSSCQLLYYCTGVIPVQLNTKLDSE
ncbi:4978_t:CDS:2 [Funneliformis caledonium]|uniref:4978_t:CDS:1 n=1 Tax=Funneliformis caledonium TaxID=1117310 RepID=A0A9N9FZJ5_9GLOM|nr:4978_t:CDS:2 [Funneliformis caledonium]